MSKRLGFVSTFLDKFRKANRTNSVLGILVGEDEYGNKYYEGHPDSKGKRKRQVIPPVVEDEEGIPKAPKKVPVEWQTWLQFRRPTPPTQVERMKNEQYKARTLHRAMELENARHSIDALRDAEKAEEVESEDKAKQFPVYSEYEIVSDDNYPPDDKDKR